MSQAIAKLALEARRFGTGTLPTLVLVTDDDRLPDPLSAAQRLPRGSLVVVRTRHAARRAGLAATLAYIARRRGLFLLIADDPLLAARLGADGVHFPEVRAHEIAYWRARRPDWFFTASAHSLCAVARANIFGADAVFLSPIFPTRSHPERAAMNPLRLRLIARESRVPIYALGGIDVRSIGRLRDARLAGVAAVGALANQN